MKKSLQKKLEAKIKDSLDSHKKMTGYQENIFKVIDLLTKSILKGGKLLLCGNGGSAADAQHLAAEFLVRLRPKINRAPLPAITLAQDTSTITALANDYDFKYTENEIKILKKIAEWPKCIEISSMKLEPHRIPIYLYELSSDFHAYWNMGKEDTSKRFINDKKEISNDKLVFLKIISNVIKSGMNIIGVNTPEKM